MSSFDVVVIGAGAIGSSVAYHLTKKGYEVALVERGDIANGTSSHCDAVALICDKKPGIDTEMGYASIQVFKELAKEFSYDFEFHQRGSLYVCETDQELEIANDYVKQQQADGYDMRMVDPKEMQEMEPYLAKDLVGGIWTEPDSSMSPYKLCFAFVEEAKKLGLKVFTHHNVLDIKLDEKGAIESVVTDKCTIKTKRVVNCGGAWSPALGQMVGIDIPIKPRKGVILISEKSFKIVNQKVHEFGYMLSKFEDINFKRNVSELVEKHNVAFNIEPTEADNFLLGGHREFKGFDISTELEVMQAIAERGIRFFPIIKEINCIRAYAGVRPYCEDHLPIVSEVEEVPGYYIAAGHEGDGISLSGITGRMMTQIIAGEETDFNIDKLNFSRYKKKA
ncbi:NAD(P)/FAD-dependent oxidoreductase [Sinanaerobacter chloroacetimidivorans]|jgi:glycine/D-amino acid oxidase-like deaminating enzyme|uniref:FAD-binding oxidoreductase n=1 Tax=Sinanaerobacter chloroacetimidivorans TaxID=2818044 RepID=A0A8J7W7R6_9FIRM|nr:FAD-dependent oxidoreductase [Sinanaerobacter chloroacetimidivorans]MBR0600496.1 FAD-binding oxidoreductase [Sinanaerobacter chloroacetimidivorans]